MKQGRLYYSGQIFAYQGRESWGLSFKKSQKPHVGPNSKKVSTKWTIWTQSFYLIPCGLFVEGQMMWFLQICKVTYFCKIFNIAERWVYFLSVENLIFLGQFIQNDNFRDILVQVNKAFYGWIWMKPWFKKTKGLSIIHKGKATFA